MTILRRITSAITRSLTSALTEGGGGLLPLSVYGPSNPIYIAHRGAALRAPENTLEAYRAAMSSGLRVIEQDVRLLSDSALGLMHDATVDATTTSTGNVTAFNTAGWAALAIDSNNWLGSDFGNALVPPLLPAVLSEFKGRAIFVPEAKVTGSGAAIVSALQAAGISTDQALVQATALVELSSAVSADYPAMFLTTGTAEIANAQAAGVTWIGLAHTEADATFTAWIAAGFKVVAHTVNRRWIRDRLLALGVSGFFSDDPEYLRASQPIATADTFSSMRWMAGMVPSNDNQSPHHRGKFQSGEYVLDAAANATMFILQGWAAPIKGNANADNFTVDLTIQFDSANGGDESRWASVFLGSSDRAFADGAPFNTETAGYHVLFRKNGQINLFKRTDVGNTSLGSVSGAAIANGGVVQFRIIVTPTTITVNRMSGETVVNTLPASDATYRGGYMHFGRNGLACQFRDVLIS